MQPVTIQDLTSANDHYQAYAAAQLADLAAQVAAIQSDLRRYDIAKAKQDWLAAQLDWERVGASYDSFGDLGLAVDGLPDGYPGGVNDKDFTGLHRLEYGLWHGQSAAELEQVTAALAKNVAAVRKNLTTDDLAGDPPNLPIRAHEILEDALRDHLSGIDDQGSGAAFAQTYADVQVTRVILGYLAPLIDARQPGLAGNSTAELDTLDQALLATRAPRAPQANGAWTSLGAASPSARAHVDAAIGAELESAASVPDLLEAPSTPTDSSEGACTVVNPSRRNFLRGAISGAAGTAPGLWRADRWREGRRRRRHRRERCGRAGDGAVVPLPRRAPGRDPHPGPRRQAAVHLRRRVRLHGRRQGRADRPAARAHRPGAVPDARRHAAGPRREPAAVGQRDGAGAERARRRADRDAVRRAPACSTTGTASRAASR